MSTQNRKKPQPQPSTSTSTSTSTAPRPPTLTPQQQIAQLTARLQSQSSLLERAVKKIDSLETKVKEVGERKENENLSTTLPEALGNMKAMDKEITALKLDLNQLRGSQGATDSSGDVQMQDTRQGQFRATLTRRGMFEFGWSAHIIARDPLFPPPPF